MENKVNSEKEAIAENDLKWLLIDLDSTIADNSGYPLYELTHPLPQAKESLKYLEKKGWKIIIYTARAWADYSYIETWLNKYKITFRRIICGKPLGKFLIDDRAIHFGGSWSRFLKDNDNL